ncbi:MAG: carbon-nitrogen hydrolase family protein [Candidatus Eremiobacteraeota bacterium]|nr:carbon-nitrogen hydrolase family protein [Candidatus Eremiobacteraeota bacterium]
MKRRILVASLQIEAHQRSEFAKNWPAIVRRIQEAARAGSKIIVLPEGTAPAYVLGYDPYDGKESLQALANCRAIAQDFRTTIVIGSARKDRSCLYNSATVLDNDGTVAGVTDKQFLWHFDSQWFSPGKRLEPIPSSAGTLGALICADGRIPTIAATLARKGAQILVMPTAWVTSGRDALALENVQADLLAGIRARENSLPFIAANKVGVELGCVAYCGKSQIRNAAGDLVAMASQDRAETLLAEVELNEAVFGPIEPAANISTRTPLQASMRVAISAENVMSIARDHLRILQSDALIATDSAAHEIDATVPTIFATDAMMFDPAGLVPYKLAGYGLCVWRTGYDRNWQEAFARARAIELRMYVVVIDTKHNRAYAVDPDGAIVCGTFGDYRIAAFTLDPARVTQTLVAPSTDIIDGLRRASVAASRR